MAEILRPNDGAAQFEQRIRRIFHITAGQLIQKVRMDAAVQRLRESDEEDEIRRRHAAHYLGLAEERSEQLGGSDRRAALDAMGRVLTAGPAAASAVRAPACRSPRREMSMPPSVVTERGDVAQVTDGDAPPTSYVRFHSRDAGSHPAPDSTAPASTATRALPTMSGSVGDSLTKRGRRVAARARRTTSASVRGSAPNSMPPAFTFGQLTFSS